MKWIVVIFNKCATRSEIKHEVFTNKIFLTNLKLKQSFQQQITDSSIDKIFSFPVKIDESLFWRHIETD